MKDIYVKSLKLSGRCADFYHTDPILISKWCQIVFVHFEEKQQIDFFPEWKEQIWAWYYVMWPDVTVLPHLCRTLVTISQPLVFTQHPLDLIVNLCG